MFPIRVIADLLGRIRRLPVRPDRCMLMVARGRLEFVRILSQSELGGMKVASSTKEFE